VTGFSEVGIESLLRRLAPGFDTQCVGAAPDAIDRIEGTAGRPLPEFYRWFLSRMGDNMGPLAYGTLDFSASTILSCYEQRIVLPNPRLVLIAFENDEIDPKHLFYDLEHPERNDARVVKRYAAGGELSKQFETLREMIAWGQFLRYGLSQFAQCCRGIFTDERADVLAHLDPVMARLGFSIPVTMGPFCRIYEGPEMALISSAEPSDRPVKYHYFRVGGANAGAIRKLFGAIATETSIEVTESEWKPSLP
jgi:hypothetical protein